MIWHQQDFVRGFKYFAFYSTKLLTSGNTGTHPTAVTAFVIPDIPKSSASIRLPTGSPQDLYRVTAVPKTGNNRYCRLLRAGFA